MAFLCRRLIAVTTLCAILMLAVPLQADEREVSTADTYRANDFAALRARFADPPRVAGPWVYWFWFDNVVSREEISREIREMVAAGIAGAELRFVVADGFPGFDAPWFSPAGWTKLLEKCPDMLQTDRLQARLQQAEADGKILDFRSGGWSSAVTNVRSIRWVPAAARLSFQHRRVHGAEVYFLMNWGGEFGGWVTFPVVGLVPELWNADTGNTFPAGMYRADDKTLAISRQGDRIRFVVQPNPVASVVLKQARVAMPADRSIHGLPPATGPVPLR